MLVGESDNISNDGITLGTCFSMFVYISARFRFALSDKYMTAQSTGSHRRWRWNSNSRDVVASSPSFSRPAARALRRACSQAISWLMSKRIDLNPVHTNALSFPNVCISMRLGLPLTLIRSAFAFSSKTLLKVVQTKMHTYGISVDCRNPIEIKTMTGNISSACVCSKRIDFNFCHNLQFYDFRTF